MTSLNHHPYRALSRKRSLPFRRVAEASCCLLFTWLLPTFLSRCPAQADAAGVRSFSARQLPATRLTEADAPPKIDGDVSDPVWKRAARADSFIDPQTGKPTSNQTEAYLLYDKKFIYVAFTCHDSQPDGIVARETIRDADMSSDDTVRVTIDPFFTRKFSDYAIFVVNPIGTRRTILGGGRASKVEWQGDWDAAARRTADGWTAEMRIPWSILSYPQKHGPCQMGLNFRRQEARTKIESLWSDLGPQYFNDRDGIWQGVEAPAQAWKPRLSMLPYLEPTGQVSGGRSQFRSGLDARYQPTSELTAVATLNPDFASVEGAVEGIGFTRSERFVPDKRPFFLEGQNYLQLGEDYEIGPYFDSARISQLDTGIKVYGKVNPATTLGMLSTVAFGHQANVVTQVRQEFGPTSSANIMLLQHLEPYHDNTVAALAQHIRQGKWSVDGQLAQTAGPEAGGMAWTAALNLEDKNLFTTVRYRRVGSTFLDRLGFIAFNDYRGWSSYTHWEAQWRHGALRGFGLDFSPTWDWHLDGRPFRRNAFFGIGFQTRSDYEFAFQVNGGKFDTDTDFTYGFSFGGNVSNRFKRWHIDFMTGQQANKPYTSFGPSFSVRLFQKLDLALSTFVQNYGGISQQHILTFNYALSPYRGWGGRVVIENSNTNIYLSYHNSGKAGTDTYFIIGDPNGKRFTQRVMMKWVLAL